MDSELESGTAVLNSSEATKGVSDVETGGAAEALPPENVPEEADSFVKCMNPSATKLWFTRTQQTSGLNIYKDDDGKVIATAGVHWGQTMMMKVVFGNEDTTRIQLLRKNPRRSPRGEERFLSGSGGRCQLTRVQLEV